MSLDWNYKIAETIRNLENENFTKHLVDAIHACVDFNFSVIFGYLGDAVPIDLYDTFDKGKHKVHVTQYQDGPYLLDPFYQACHNMTASGLYRLKELAPDRFYQSEYYRSYYRKTKLAEEIGFFIQLPHGAYVVISLMRADNMSVFNQKEMRQLREIEPVVRALCERHWENLYLKFKDGGQDQRKVILQEQIEEAFSSFGKSVLTARELEVVGLVLRGYSSEAIADILNIAKGTVKTYRRSIYAKLSISSQSELFSMFLNSLSSAEETEQHN